MRSGFTRGTIRARAVDTMNMIIEIALGIVAGLGLLVLLCAALAWLARLPDMVKLMGALTLIGSTCVALKVML